MGNPIVEEIERALLRRPTLRSVVERSAGTAAEVLASDPQRSLCQIRYVPPSGGVLERWALVSRLEGFSGVFPQRGDSVWVNFVGGDPSLPVVVAYVRPRHTYETSAAGLPGAPGA